MDELIYQFLLQAGFPRAAIVSDATLLSPGRSTGPPEDASTYAIVDPDTADRLAVIDVVGAIDGDTLQETASRVGQYARRLGGDIVQGFVIRVDPNGRSDAEQVQFYRVWPNARVQQLTAKTFPDLDGLRVTHLLAIERAVPVEPEIIDLTEDEEPEPAPRPSGAGAAARYVPAILLLLVAVFDWYLVQTRGSGLLSAVQAMLVIGAAALLTLVALVRNRH